MINQYKPRFQGCVQASFPRFLPKVYVRGLCAKPLTQASFPSLFPKVVSKPLSQASVPCHLCQVVMFA